MTMLPLQSARAAAVPAAVALGQLEHRRPSTRPRRAAAARRSGSRAARSACPRGPARGRARSSRRRASATCVTSCRPDVGERVDDPLRRLLALLGRVLLRVGDRLERDELGQVVLRAVHQRMDGRRRSSTGTGFPPHLMRGGDGVRSGSCGRWPPPRPRARRPARLSAAQRTGDQQDAGGGQIAIISARRAEAGGERVATADSPASWWLLATALLTIATAATATAAPT